MAETRKREVYYEKRSVFRRQTAEWIVRKRPVRKGDVIAVIMGDEGRLVRKSRERWEGLDPIRPFWLLFFSGGSPTFIWPWEGSNYPSQSCNGPNGPKGPKFKQNKNKRALNWPAREKDYQCCQYSHLHIYRHLRYPVGFSKSWRSKAGHETEKNRSQKEGDGVLHWNNFWTIIVSNK